MNNIKLNCLCSFGIFTLQTDYQQKHVSWTPVFTADENLLAGNHYYAVPKVPITAPDCWKETFAKAQAEQSVLV